MNLTDIGKAVVKKYLKRRTEVLARNALAHLRGMNHRRMKHRILSKQVIQAFYVSILCHLMPGSHGVYRHIQLSHQHHKVNPHRQQYQ